jgi:hypothetical protein
LPFVEGVPVQILLSGGAGKAPGWMSPLRNVTRVAPQGHVKCFTRPEFQQRPSQPAIGMGPALAIVLDKVRRDGRNASPFLKMVVNQRCALFRSALAPIDGGDPDGPDGRSLSNGGRCRKREPISSADLTSAS